MALWYNGLMDQLLHFSPLIEQTLADGGAVVALESTVITHGLPYPQNVETALAMEAAVASGGAVPATIAILGGKATIGLSHDEIEYLGQLAGGDRVRKCSRRDLPIALACGEDGATTVAGTMILAALAHIELFATGGIGESTAGTPLISVPTYASWAKRRSLSSAVARNPSWICRQHARFWKQKE